MFKMCKPHGWGNISKMQGRLSIHLSSFILRMPPLWQLNYTLNTNIVYCLYNTKHLEKFLDVFKGHLIWMNILFRKDESSTFSLRGGQMLCLIISIGSLSLLMNRCKKPSLFYTLWFAYVTFILLSPCVFLMSRAYKWGTFPKCRFRFIYNLVLGPYFENVFTSALYPIGC